MDGSTILGRREASRLVRAAAAGDVRALLERWRAAPLRTAAPWLAGALALATLMLAAALTVALASPPGAPFTPAFVDPGAGTGDFARILGRNLLVLLLNTLVCFAAYLSSRSLPLHAQHSRGAARTLHERAASACLAAVAALALYAFAWQAWRLGHDLSSAAATLHLSRSGLLVRLALHAVPELTAVFLPLAAALVLWRRGRRDDLAGAALAAGLAALPLLTLAAALEVWVTRALF